MPPKTKDSTITKDSTDQKLYQKLSHLEHVLKRPSTYIGSIEKTREDAFVLDKSDPENACIKRESIEFIPGLYKLVDEIIVSIKLRCHAHFLLIYGGINVGSSIHMALSKLILYKGVSRIRYSAILANFL